MSPVHYDPTTKNEMKNQAAAVARQRRRWINAINCGSAENLVEVVTDDVVWLPSRSDAVVGKKEIRDWLAGPFRMYDYNYTVSELRLRVAGDWAIELARFETVVSTGDDEPLPSHRGSYIVLWRRYPVDRWLIERYVDLSAQFTDVT